MKKYTSFGEISDCLSKGEASCETIVNHYLDQIESQRDLNVFVEVYAEEALNRAKEMDQKIAKGQGGKLAGMVVGIKDVICHKDHGLQAASKILDGFQSQFNATVIDRLIAEDAIIIGRQNCDEFAMGSSNENSAFGPTKNAANPEHVPGGSSGASAVAVQANMCTVSLGSDTGGSVRQPAAFCGVIGLKPTYSRISRYGLIAYASSFDSIGVLSTTVEDNALMLEVIAGADDFDSTVSNEPVDNYVKGLGESKKYKIAYIQNTLDSSGIATDVKEATLSAIEKLKSKGHEVSPISFDLLDYILPTYYILTTAEASSNLSRYDGVKYGYRTPHAHNLEEMYKMTREEGFGKEVQRRIMLGTFVLSSGYYDAYYIKAQKVRRLIREKTQELLQQYDFLVMPTTPTAAFKFGEHSDDPIEMYLADLYTVQANVCGVPAISIPNGETTDGLPIGLQFMGAAFQEKKLYQIAKSFLDS